MTIVDVLTSQLDRWFAQVGAVNTMPDGRKFEVVAIGAAHYDATYTRLHCREV